jgi:cytochrome c oxidase assembly protein subunit 19
MNLSRGKSASPKPPEKGSFPLDHDSECGVLMRHYMQCLKENEFVSRYCRTYSKQYLQCRMNNGLMAPEELSMLGFDGTEDKMTKPLKSAPPK